MTDLRTQLDAILHGAAFAPLSEPGYEAFACGFLRITGPDATRWLNGMVTNNIKDLAPGEGNYNFLLNAQGRIQGDCTIYREPGDGEPTYLLETGSSQIDTIHQLLDKFIIMDDVELAHLEIDGIVLLGKTAEKHSLSLELPFPDFGVLSPIATESLGKMFKSFLRNGSLLTLYPPKSQVWSMDRVESWSIDAAEINAVRASLLSVGTAQLTPEALEAYRILSATPRYGTDIRNTETNKDLPQETAQTHALHFNKGCYLGQEIVERIHSRGAVHRTFAQFTLSGPVPTLPAPLELDGKTVGELTSAALIPLSTGDTTLALGYARLEALDKPLTYPGGTATRTNASKLKTDI